MIKEGFFSEHWTTMLIMVVLYIVGIYTKSIGWVIIATIFLILIVMAYLKFDADESACDKWWATQNKDKKVSIRGAYNGKE